MKDQLRRMAASLTEAVYLKLRKELLDCRIHPGDRLKIGELAEQYDVNQGSIREALSRLTSEGLVTLESQKGFRAAPVSVDDLRDLTRARIEIEILCLKSSMASGDVEWESRIVAAFHRMIRAPEMETTGRTSRLNEAWASAHADFHLALVSACDSQWLLKMRDMLYVQSERYRRLSVPLRLKVSDERSSQQERDHRKLMEAAMSRNESKAATTITEHFGKTADIVAKLLPFQTAASSATRPPGRGARMLAGSG